MFILTVGLRRHGWGGSGYLGLTAAAGGLADGRMRMGRRRPTAAGRFIMMGGTAEAATATTARQHAVRARAPATATAIYSDQRMSEMELL